MYNALIVDDEILFLRYLREQIPWSQYRICIVRSFTSAQLALDYLRENPSIDLVLTDIKMPGMNGIDLIRALPSAARMRAFILVLSGYDDFQLVREAFLAGASDYILKVDVNTPAFDKTMGQILEYLSARAPAGAARRAGEDESAHPSAAIKEYVLNNLAQPLSLGGIAARFGFSPGYLSQLFSHEEGMTLSEYIIGMRVSRAQRLLLESDRAITDISYDVGFNSPEHFSRTFRRQTGMSPRQWRECGGSGEGE